MDNTQLTPLRKRNSKVSRRLAAAIEKAMGTPTLLTVSKMREEFKRALLGSKLKTQRLPGDYVIPLLHQTRWMSTGKAPSNANLQPPSNLRGNVNNDPPKELPVFKPNAKSSEALPIAVCTFGGFVPARGYCRWRGAVHAGTYPSTIYECIVSYQ